MKYSDKQQTEIDERVRNFEKRGQPERAHKLRVQVADGVAFDELEGKPADVQEEADELPEPPRAGPGSGVDAWRAFAKEVSDLDDEVIDAMGRDEIVSTLEEAEIIEPLDPTE